MKFSVKESRYTQQSFVVPIFFNSEPITFSNLQRSEKQLKSASFRMASILEAGAGIS